MVRVLINGANGKMGAWAVRTLSEAPDFVVVGETGRQDVLCEAIRQTRPEVVLDLTEPLGLFERVESIISANARPVIGTSGLTVGEITLLQAQCAEIGLGGLVVPNFSLSMALFLRCIKEIAPYFPEVEIIEQHPKEKKDAPSGTARYTAELIQNVRKRQIFPGAEEPVSVPKPISDPIAIHSLRLAGLVASQTVVFGSGNETITLRQDTLSRAAFMSGIQYCCKRVMDLDRLYYGVEEVLGV